MRVVMENPHFEEAAMRKGPSYISHAYRQAEADAKPTLIESNWIVANSDDEAIERATPIRLRLDPTFFEIWEEANGHKRLVYRATSPTESNPPSTDRFYRRGPAE